MKVVATNSKRQQRVYHTQETCPYLQRAGDTKDVSTEFVETWDYEQCQWCRDDITRPDEETEWSEFNRKLRAGKI